MNSAYNFNLYIKDNCLSVLYIQVWLYLICSEYVYSIFISCVTSRYLIGWVRDCCLCQISNFSALLWREQATFGQMMIMSVLYETDIPSWIFIVLAHCYKCCSIRNTLSWFRVNQSLLLLLNAACLENFISLLFDPIRVRTHPNHYPTDAARP